MANVSFILLYVDDVEASVAFYSAALGRPAAGSSPTFAMIPAAPGLMLGLWRRDGVAPPAGVPGGGEIAVMAADEAEVAVTDRALAGARRAGRPGADADGLRLHRRRPRPRRPPPAGVRPGRNAGARTRRRTGGRRGLASVQVRPRHVETPPAAAPQEEGRLDCLQATPLDGRSVADQRGFRLSQFARSAAAVRYASGRIKALGALL